MRIRTFLVLILATLSSSCFNLASAKRENGPPTNFFSAAENAVLKVKTIDENLITRMKAAHEKITAISRIHDVDLSDIKKEMDILTRLDNENELTPDMIADRLKLYVNNIEANPLMKLPQAAPYKNLAEKAAEVIAKNPSNWKLVWRILMIIYGGAIVGLMFAALYGVSN